MDHEHDRNQLERLAFFSDAVFAIAITLLVIEVHVPVLDAPDDRALGLALLRQVPQYVGFVTSFLVIGRFWVAHHEVFGLLRATSARLVWSNLVLLLTIAFLPFPTAVLSRYVTLRAAVAFYTGWLILIGLAQRRVIALSLGDPRLRRADVGEALARFRLRAGWTPVLVGVTGLALGMAVPALSVAGLLLGSIVFGRLMRRHDPRLRG